MEKLDSKWIAATALAFVTGFAAFAAAAATTVTVSQKNRAFGPGYITITKGDVIRFTNDDEFLHQIYTKAAGFAFDSDEQSPGHPLVITFPTAGVFEVRCGIHPKMLLTVTVK
jgi:plastocyanin